MVGSKRNSPAIPHIRPLTPGILLRPSDQPSVIRFPTEAQTANDFGVDWRTTAADPRLTAFGREFHKSPSAATCYTTRELKSKRSPASPRRRRRRGVAADRTVCMIL